MIRITIADMKDRKEVFSIAELREILSVRYDNDANSFDISPLGQVYPHLTVIIKQDIATLWYLSEDKDTFVPYNPENNFDPNGWTILYYGAPNEIQNTRNNQIVAASDALRAAEEFAVTQATPSSIRWSEV
jgi:hypothetical protein